MSATIIILPIRKDDEPEEESRPRRQKEIFAIAGRVPRARPCLVVDNKRGSDVR